MSRLRLIGLVLVSLGLSSCCPFNRVLNYPCLSCGTCPPGQVFFVNSCFPCDSASLPAESRCATPPPPAPPPPAVEVGGGGGIDRSTDGAVVQIAVGYGLRPIAIEGGLEIGQASEDGYEVPEGIARGGDGDFSQDYGVFQAFLHGKYPVPIMDGRARVYPLAGLRYLRYSAKDCEEVGGVECVFPEMTLDVGGGIGYGPFSLDAYTGLAGDVPDLSFRVRAMVPLPFGRPRPAAPSAPERGVPVGE